MMRKKGFSWASAAALLLSAAAAHSAPVAAAPLREARAAMGKWELQSADGHFKCEILLRSDPGNGGYALGAPATCRRSMSILSKAVSWNVSGGDRLTLLDASGSVSTMFEKRNEAFVAVDEQGQAYTLKPLGLRNASMAANATKFEEVEMAPSARTEAPPVGSFGSRHSQNEAMAAHGAAPAAVRAVDLPGRYAILRDTTRDTGCMLTLQPGGKAQLAPACRDNGIVIFEPTAWSFGEGKLSLTARKGHKALFEMTADGSWQKSSEEGGKPLGFRKR